MKKTVKFLTMGLLFIGMTTLVGCKKDYITKEDADNKYVQQGANNNTVQTEVFTTNSNQWIQSGSSSSYFYNHSSTKITSDVISNGAVMVYLGDGSGNLWIAMPFSRSGLEFMYGIEPSNVQVDISQSNGLMPNNPGGQQFKVVIIPPSGMKANPNVDLTNYNEVAKVFNL